MHRAPAPKIEGKDPVAERVIAGPLVAPGKYQVSLTVGDQTLTETFEIVKTPGVTASEADLQEQHDLAMKMHTKVGEVIQVVNQLRDLRGQLDGWTKRTTNADLTQAATALRDKVAEVEKKLQVPDLQPGWGYLNHGVKLLDRLISLPNAVNLGDYRPTDQAYQMFDQLKSELAPVLQEVETLLSTDLAALNQKIAAAQLGAVTVKTAAAPPAPDQPGDTSDDTPPPGVEGEEPGRQRSRLTLQLAL